MLVLYFYTFTSYAVYKVTPDTQIKLRALLSIEKEVITGNTDNFIPKVALLICEQFLSMSFGQK
jgi:hypothetical protein